MVRDRAGHLSLTSTADMVISLHSPPHNGTFVLPSHYQARMTLSEYVPTAIASAAVVAASYFVTTPTNTNDHQGSSPTPRHSAHSIPSIPYWASSSSPQQHFVNTPPMASAGNRKFDEERRAELKRIANDTLRALNYGNYPFKGIDKDLSGPMEYSKRNTKYYPPDSPIREWAENPQNLPPDSSPTHISVLHVSTLDAARLLENVYKNNPSKRGKTGVLNFASATKPGGGFKNGAEAQEESIARSSTLYPCLTTDEANKFYKLHSRESADNHPAYYSHAIIYSPKVTVFRDDDGIYTYPFNVDVLTCAAVNAGEVRKTITVSVRSGLEVGIEKEMKERMGRILYVFEQEGVRNIILGTFGTGVFKNDVAIVARIWAHLLIVPDARFKDSFDRIIFAITGDKTFGDFQGAFEAWGKPRAPGIKPSRRGPGLNLTPWS